MARTGRITAKGDWHGEIVRECEDSMDCPRFVGVDGRGVTIVYAADQISPRYGEIVAVRDREVRWL